MSHPQPLSITTPPAASGKLQTIKPRIVQIGLNLISLLDVNDKMHYFEGNVLMVRPPPAPPFRTLTPPPKARLLGRGAHAKGLALLPPVDSNPQREAH